MTSVASAVESLQLQKQRHMSEILITKHKQRCAEMKRANDTALRTSPQGEAAKEPGEALDTGDVYRTMEECDSLLAFLRDRASGRFNEEDKDIQPTKRPGVKAPKDDKTIIEELRVHNDALRGHILELLRENEGYYTELLALRKENAELHAQLHGDQAGDLHQETNEPSALLVESTDSEKSEKYFPNPDRIDINILPTMELPPLEMPKFDFDSLGKLSSSMKDSQ